MKRDGGERKPSREETPSKRQKVPFRDEKTGQPNPIIPILSSLRSPSAPSGPREVFALLGEESLMKKLRPSDDSSKKAKINMVKVGRRRSLPCR